MYFYKYIYLNTNFLTDIIKNNHFYNSYCYPKINTGKIRQYFIRKIVI